MVIKKIPAYAGMTIQVRGFRASTRPAMTIEY